MNSKEQSYKILIGLAFSMNLIACVNTPVPESFHYILDKSPKPVAKVINQQTPLPQTRVKVLPVQVPDYLNQANLVLKLSNHQVKIANYHFWAEDLPSSIHRVLLNELNSTSTDKLYGHRCIQCEVLAITIDHFYPTEQGDVVLSGTYEEIAANGSVQSQSFSLNKKLASGGYDESVATMRALLSELASQIN